MERIVLAVFLFFLGAGVGITIVGNQMNKVVEEKHHSSEKFRIMYQMVERWMRIKQSDRTLVKYFEAHGYKNIAVYGMADIGKLLINELKNSSITVAYGIDKNINASSVVEVFAPEESLKDVDAVVVTAIAYFDEIERMLSAKMKCPIISLEDLVYELG